MEYVLLAAFVIGLLLFIFSWIKVFIAGLGHHSVTGLIAAIPVVNLLILPTIWHRAYSWFMVGFIGLIVAVGTWFMGADRPFYQHGQALGIDFDVMGVEVPEESAIEKKLRLEGEKKIVETTMPAEPLAPSRDLPDRALYKMTFTSVTTGKLGQYKNRYVRITRNDRKVFEGKLLSVDGNALTMERRASGGVIKHNIAFTDIKNAEVMSRR